MPRLTIDQHQNHDAAPARALFVAGAEAGEQRAPCDPVWRTNAPGDLSWSDWDNARSGAVNTVGPAVPKLPRDMQGDDIVFLRLGNDVRWLGAGDDFGFGNAGDDTIFGDSGNDWIMGGGGDDRIAGGTGHDVLIGGLGDDMLVGGTGADVFIFTEDHRHDVIKDFDITQDVIRLGPSVDVIAIVDTPDGALIATQEGSIVVENVDAQMLGDANLLTF